MKKLVLFGILVTLAACGVDGDPTAPRAQDAPPPGVTVSGDVRMGVVKKF